MTMTNMTLSPERRAAILRETNAKRRRPIRWTIGKMVLAAVLAAVLTVSALAAAIPALRAALGSFTAQSQPITGIVSEQDGIEIRPVAALSDSNLTRIFCEVQDKTGDRLSADMDIDFRMEGLPNLNASVFGAKVISYDADTHTALISLLQTGYQIKDETPVTLTFAGFQPRVDIKTDALPQSLLSSKIRETFTPADLTVTNQGSDSVLIPLTVGQTPMTLPGTDAITLSSLGFDSANRLHFQFALASGMSPDNTAGLLTNVFRKDGKDAGHTIDTLHFIKDGVIYYEVCLSGGFTAADAPQLTLDRVYGSLSDKPGVTGDWNVEMKITPVSEIAYQPHTQVGGVLVREVTVTELSVLAVSDAEHDMLSRNPTYATLRDGTKLTLTNSTTGSMWSRDDDGVGHAYDRWAFDTPVNPADVVSLNFDGVAVLLQ